MSIASVHPPSVRGAPPLLLAVFREGERAPSPNLEAGSGFSLSRESERGKRDANAGRGSGTTLQPWMPKFSSCLPLVHPLQLLTKLLLPVRSVTDGTLVRPAVPSIALLPRCRQQPTFKLFQSQS